MMDLYSFIGLQNLNTIKKLAKTKTFCNITLSVFVWKDKVIYTWDSLRVIKSWENVNFLDELTI